MARLTDVQWQAIRLRYEYDPDEPSLEASGARAGKEHGFKPPSKQSIHDRSRRDSWDRRGSLDGINQAAHRLADKLDAKPDAVRQQSSRREAEETRADLLRRHRAEYAELNALRHVALEQMTIAAEAGDREAWATAKIAADSARVNIAALVEFQKGERAAWGIEAVGDSEQGANRPVLRIEYVKNTTP